MAESEDEKIEREKEEHEAREQAERDAREKEEREKAEREEREKAEREANEKGNTDVAAKIETLEKGLAECMAILADHIGEVNGDLEEIDERLLALTPQPAPESVEIAELHEKPIEHGSEHTDEKPEPERPKRRNFTRIF